MGDINETNDRCPGCDRRLLPATDAEHWVNCADGPVSCNRCERIDADDTVCFGASVDGSCEGHTVDWRARALAAEADFFARVEERVTDAVAVIIDERDKATSRALAAEANAPDRPCSGCGDMVSGDPVCGACWRKTFADGIAAQERARVVAFVRAASRLLGCSACDDEECAANKARRLAKAIEAGEHLAGEVKS